MIRRLIENGRLLFPKKFNLRFDAQRKNWVPVAEPCMDFVDYLKKSLKPSMWSSQYLNEPIAEEDQKFRREYFQYFDRRPEGLYLAMTVDLAVGLKKESDSTAVAIVGKSHDEKLYVLDRLKGQWRVSEHPDVLAMEDNGFQVVLKEGLETAMNRRGIYVPVHGLTHGSDRSKEYRVEALEPFYRNGLVYHANWMRDSDLELELMSFPKGQHDDIIDALSMALEVLAPGETAFADDAPKPGTYAWEADRIDRQANEVNVESFFRGLIPEDYGRG
jgi:predicted phage terminase large subunit-like protein